MNAKPTSIPGLALISTEVSRDDRGSFERLFCASHWHHTRPEMLLSQVNLSTTTTRGTIRGLHFQAPPALEDKLIRCVRGHVYDVAVDLRQGSPTFLQWRGHELRSDHPWELFIPAGFAHGFQSLTDDVQLLYFHSAPWSPASEGGLRHDDPLLGIKWPLPVTNISERDRSHPMLDESFVGIRA